SGAIEIDYRSSSNKQMMQAVAHEIVHKLATVWSGETAGDAVLPFEDYTELMQVYVDTGLLKPESAIQYPGMSFSMEEIIESFGADASKFSDSSKMQLARSLNPERKYFGDTEAAAVSEKLDKFSQRFTQSEAADMKVYKANLDYLLAPSEVIAYAAAGPKTDSLDKFYDVVFSDNDTGTGGLDNIKNIVQKNMLRTEEDGNEVVYSYDSNSMKWKQESSKPLIEPQNVASLIYEKLTASGQAPDIGTVQKAVVLADAMTPQTVTVSDLAANLPVQVIGIQGQVSTLDTNTPITTVGDLQQAMASGNVNIQGVTDSAVKTDLLNYAAVQAAILNLSGVDSTRPDVAAITNDLLSGNIDVSAIVRSPEQAANIIYNSYDKVETDQITDILLVADALTPDSVGVDVLADSLPVSSIGVTKTLKTADNTKIETVGDFRQAFADGNIKGLNNTAMVRAAAGAAKLDLASVIASTPEIGQLLDMVTDTGSFVETVSQVAAGPQLAVLAGRGSLAKTIADKPLQSAAAIYKQAEKAGLAVDASDVLVVADALTPEFASVPLLADSLPVEAAGVDQNTAGVKTVGELRNKIYSSPSQLKDLDTTQMNDIKLNIAKLDLASASISNPAVQDILDDIATGKTDVSILKDIIHNPETGASVFYEKTGVSDTQAVIDVVNALTPDMVKSEDLINNLPVSAVGVDTQVVRSSDNSQINTVADFKAAYEDNDVKGLDASGIVKAMTEVVKLENNQVISMRPQIGQILDSVASDTDIMTKIYDNPQDAAGIIDNMVTAAGDDVDLSDIIVAANYITPESVQVTDLVDNLGSGVLDIPQIDQDKKISDIRVDIETGKLTPEVAVQFNKAVTKLEIAPAMIYS
ncbi:hypothetical protein ACFLTD_05535, partial [Elusimicrobiota bacterium]